MHVRAIAHGDSMRQGGGHIHSKSTQHLHLPLGYQGGNLTPICWGLSDARVLPLAQAGGWISGVYQMASSFRGPVWPGRLHVLLPARLLLHWCQPSPAAVGLGRGSWHNSGAQPSDRGTSPCCCSPPHRGCVCAGHAAPGVGTDDAWGGERHAGPSGLPRGSFLLLLFSYNGNPTLAVSALRAGHWGCLCPATQSHPGWGPSNQKGPFPPLLPATLEGWGGRAS